MPESPAPSPQPAPPAASRRALGWQRNSLTFAIVLALLLGLLLPTAAVLLYDGQKTRETVNVLARLDMPGPIRSLNVSNAAAVSLYAARRHLAGPG